MPNGGARVLMLDRYEIGERQTSACAAPTAWLDVLGLRLDPQTFDPRSCTPPHDRALPAAVDLLDIRLPGALRAARRAERRRVRDRKVEGARGPGQPGASTSDRPRRVSAPLVVDALGWRRVLGRDGYQPPDAPLSRGLEVHPAGERRARDLGRRSVVPAGYGWSFPAAREVRVGVGSFDPRYHVKEPTVELAARSTATPSATRATGSPTSCARRPRPRLLRGRLRRSCLPLTAEGIRTAFYFGIASGASCAQCSKAAPRGDGAGAIRSFSAAHE